MGYNENFLILQGTSLGSCGAGFNNSTTYDSEEEARESFDKYYKYLLTQNYYEISEVDDEGGWCFPSFSYKITEKSYITKVALCRIYLNKKTIERLKNTIDTEI